MARCLHTSLSEFVNSVGELFKLSSHVSILKVLTQEQTHTHSYWSQPRFSSLSLPNRSTHTIKIEFRLIPVSTAPRATHRGASKFEQLQRASGGERIGWLLVLAPTSCGAQKMRAKLWVKPLLDVVYAAPPFLSSASCSRLRVYSRRKVHADKSERGCFSFWKVLW